jgi:hypothetical protein
MKQDHPEPGALFEIEGLDEDRCVWLVFWDGAGRRCGKPWTARCRRGEDVTVAL